MDGGIGAVVEDAGPPECVSASWPPRPHIVGNGGGFDFVTAVRKVQMGDTTIDGRPGYKTIGFDLDDVCTGPGQPNGCALPKGAIEQTDGPGGIDNAVGAGLFEGNKTMFGSGSEGVSSTAESGVITGLFSVRGYNGTSVDNEVEVAFYAGTRVDAKDAAPVQPKWQGQDEWNIFNTHLRDAGAAPPDGGPEPPITDLRAADYDPEYVDTHAFVTDHKLVAHFQELLTIAGAFARVTIVATLEKRDLGWTLTDGTFAGRIKVDSLLGPIRLQMEDGPDGGVVPVCTDGVTYPDRKRQACALADLSYAGFDDPSALCDAASWAWKFDAEPALLGRVVTLSLLPPNPCEGRDPALDTCQSEE